MAFGLVAAIFIIALKRGMPVDEVRALTFFALVTSIVALILVNRSASASLLKAICRPNRALAIVLPLVVLMLAATLLIPFVSNLFRFGPLHVADLLIALGGLHRRQHSKAASPRVLPPGAGCEFPRRRGCYGPKEGLEPRHAGSLRAVVWAGVLALCLFGRF